MSRKQIDFSIGEAGCLIYLADRNLAGLCFGELDKTDWKDLALKGALMAMELYQDDGFSVRLVTGDLTAEEHSQWTAKASWKLKLESGVMVVSGVCDPDLEKYLEEFGICENEGDYHLGCFAKVPKGEYQVDVYSYPPNDLAGGWMAIEDKGSFRASFGKDSEIPFEKPIDYFTRTRPGENPPDWIKDGYEDNSFLDFVIHLSPLSDKLQLSEVEEGGCLLWKYCKPEICPIGIRLESD